MKNMHFGHWSCIFFGFSVPRNFGKLVTSFTVSSASVKNVYTNQTILNDRMIVGILILLLLGIVCLGQGRTEVVEEAVLGMTTVGFSLNSTIPDDVHCLMLDRGFGDHKTQPWVASTELIQNMVDQALLCCDWGDVYAKKVDSLPSVTCGRYIVLQVWTWWHSWRWYRQGLIQLA